MSFIWSQVFVSLPDTTASFTDKIAIVTGSNVGLGKEAARKLANLDAKVLILAVRNTDKGEEAKRDILQSLTTSAPKDASAKRILVWPLDLSSYESVLDFGSRCARELDRLDTVIENAGVATRAFRKAEDNELTITTNVISTSLLAYLLMPKMKETAQKYNTRPVLSVVSSGVHAWTTIPERKFVAGDGKLLPVLASEETSVMGERYSLSKLLEVLFIREFAKRHPVNETQFTMNTLNPGLCHSELARESGFSLWLLKLLFARTTEYGSRTLVDAVTKGPESHGAYLDDCHVEATAPWVTSAEGKTWQKKVYEEIVHKLESIKLGVTNV